MTEDVAEQLREAVRNSKLSGNQIAAETGISQPAISQFVNGKRDLRLSAAAKIAAVLGMRLTKPKR